MSGTYEFDDDVAYVIVTVQNSPKSTDPKPSVKFFIEMPIRDVYDINNDKISESISSALEESNAYCDNMSSILSSAISSCIDGIDEAKAHLKVVRPVDYSTIRLDEGYINTSGVLVAHSNIRTTEPIYNLGSDIAFVNAYGANRASYYIAAYDANGSFLKDKSCYTNNLSAGGGVGILSSGTYHFDNSVAYARVSFSKSQGGNKLSCINYVYIDTIYPKDISSIIETASSNY